MAGFWTEVERGQFLIRNLCDSDINVGPANLYLRQLDHILLSCKDKINAGRFLYAAWSVLSSEAFDLLQADFELDDNWLIRLERANDHLFERVYSLLKKHEYEIMMESFSKIYANVRAKTVIGFIKYS